MNRKLWIAPILALGLAGAPAIAAGDEPRAQAQEEARIPFVNYGGIRDWKATDGDTIYVQDRARRWYRAELMHRAPGLPFAWAIGFDTGGLSSFDRFSSVVVDGLRVPVQSLVRVDGPPPKRDRSKQDA